ncbi:unnamed protein product [Paramecium sonneborni]|uniref:Protein kinase domain-containing protein n=1 Tax=Paramecium sonneborni TaxID=65129 RepID=A0A8S1MKK9_9CILI|nr:unnamed protein product [Paramecium sonneborni]
MEQQAINIMFWQNLGDLSAQFIVMIIKIVYYIIKQKFRMQNYKLITKKGEGTFSEVIKAQSIKTNQLVAIKCMKQVFQTIDQVLNYFYFWLTN